MAFTAFYGMPGYMPEVEPAEFETFDEARAYLFETVSRFWDEDAESETYRSDADDRWALLYGHLQLATEQDFCESDGDNNLTFHIYQLEDDNV